MADELLVLANVESLPGDVVEKLERWTAAGGAAIVTLGKQVEAASFNARLFRADGSGLAPLELASRTSIARRDGSYRVSTFDATPATLQLGGGELAPTLERCLNGLPEGERHVFLLHPHQAFGGHGAH